MRNCNRTTWTSRAGAVAVLCAALVTHGAIAATLASVAVTPSASSISVGKRQAFTATGTFSNGTTQMLGPDVANIAAGNGNTCALLRSGGVECWGENSDGELGDGTTGGDSLSARPVVGILTATAVTLGHAHGCALLASHTVKCWGFNVLGQLGNATTTDNEPTPVTVSGISTATAVGAGGSHSCALLTNGTARCWGENWFGELGDGSTTDSSTPVSVVGINTAVAISVGLFHACARLASGSVKCWGAGTSGQLGNGEVGSSSTPVTVRGISNAAAVAVGADSTCALLASGSVQCWGQNVYGQLGNGQVHSSGSSTPVAVLGISTAVALAAGFHHYCARLRDGSVDCWGDNSNGQLGKGAGTTLESGVPLAIVRVHGPTTLASGDYHNCTLFAGGLMTCWGSNGDG